MWKKSLVLVTLLIFGFGIILFEIFSPGIFLSMVTPPIAVFETNQSVSGCYAQFNVSTSPGVVIMVNSSCLTTWQFESKYPIKPYTARVEETNWYCPGGYRTIAMAYDEDDGKWKVLEWGSTRLVKRYAPWYIVAGTRVGGAFANLEDFPKGKATSKFAIGVANAYSGRPCGGQTKLSIWGEYAMLCPYECCMNLPGYIDKPCSTGFHCEDTVCVPDEEPEAYCGNGIVEGNEECDGTNLNEKTCVDLGYDTGTLQCSSNCLFDTSLCFVNTCGNGVIDDGENCANCPQDVKCPIGTHCVEEKCETNYIFIAGLAAALITVVIIFFFIRKK